MSTGIYLGDYYQTDGVFTPSDESLSDENRRKRALAYLGKQQQSRNSLGAFKPIFGWVLGALVMWALAAAMFYGF